jgi:hypothetical protein
MMIRRILTMTNEFQKRLELLRIDKRTLEELLKLIEDAGKEFPCLSCPSKDEWP